MRLVVAGAGGRMGRTLVQAIAENRSARVRRRARSAGHAGSIGRDAGELAGLGATGKMISADPQAQATADGVIDFTIPAATRDTRRTGCATRHRSYHRHHRARALKTSTTSPPQRQRARPDRQVGQYEPRRQPAGGTGQTRRAHARRGIRHRNSGNASQEQDRCPIRHRVDVRCGGGGRDVASI